MAEHKDSKQPKAIAQEAGELVERLGDASPVSGRTVKRFFVALIGSTVLLIGIAMIILPGPALIVIPAGLAILATEFLWARRALRQCKGMVTKARRKSRLLKFWRRR